MKLALESNAHLPVPSGNYCDADGFVFLDVPVSEVLPGWRELMADELAVVRALNDIDKAHIKKKTMQEPR